MTDRSGSATAGHAPSPDDCLDFLVPGWISRRFRSGPLSLCKGAWHLPRCTMAFCNTRLLRGLLTQILTPFHIEIGGSVYFAQLEGILLGCGEPAVQAFLELHRRRGSQCAEVGVDGEVIAHGVTFHHATHATDMFGRAFGLLAGQGEPHLASSNCGEVSLHGKSPSQSVIIRIGEMQKGLTVSNWYGLQLDAIVAGTQRPLLRIELDLQVFRCRRCDAIEKFEGIGIFQGLRGFLADVDRQDSGGLIGRGTAVLGIDMQEQHVTPVLRAVECRADIGKRVIDQGVDVALQVVGRFGRVED